MYFSKIHELKATLENIGDVKIIVGERNNKRDNSLLYYKKEKRVAEMSSITIGSYRLPLKFRLQIYEYFYR